MTITSAQVKAARQLLKWTQFRLAAETPVSIGATAIGRFESGKNQPSPPIVFAIQRTLEAAGVEFVDDEPGVRLRKGK